MACNNRRASPGTRYSQEYLSWLARSGRLEAVTRGRVWFTTRRAPATYQASLAGGRQDDRAYAHRE